MLLKRARNVVPYENIPDGTHFDVAKATCSVPVPSSSKSDFTICSCREHKIQLKMFKRRPNEGGTGKRLR